ncbi:hypothetical protein [Aliarcobacter thereius]|uniref:hypothetical protein n=1 Tax=Aliarcobacter thereius TaxID=544718 RepID=UPI0008259ECC|nr:hypothetical protein [Aliarcobacter thereius]OCL94154.1 hypothetical protein AAX25_00485 [Aliarcobacter thereius]
MENKKNLFIINSPLQLLNSQEAIYKFELKNIIIVAIYNRSVKNIEQIEAQLEKIDCDEIVRFNPLKEGKLQGYVKLIKYLKRYNYEYIFTGEIEDFRFRAIVANMNKTKFFLLDEGSATVVLYENVIKKNIINKFKLKSIKFVLNGLKINLKDTINFFTYYDFKPLNNGVVVKNKLKYLKKDFNIDNFFCDDTLFFLGQPLHIFYDSEEFKNSLKKIIEKNKDKQIVYIPHREDKETLKIIADNYNRINILELNQPIEKYFLQVGIYPRNLISYSSTALTTIKILFPNCLVKYIKNNKPNLKLNDIKNLDFIYKYFKKNNILEFMD